MSEELIIPGVPSDAITYIARARTYKQYCEMVKNAQEGICPFCNINPNHNKTLQENEHWRTINCNPPADFTKHHLLIIPKRHVISLVELTTFEQKTFFELLAQTKKAMKITGCGFLVRDGGARLSAGTIEHLHAHIIVPDGTQRVTQTLFKGEEKEKESFARARVFEKIRQGIGFENITPEEQVLIKDRI